KSLPKVEPLRQNSDMPELEYHNQATFQSDVVLHGTHIRLEPLERRHVDGLAAASAGDASLYRWSPVPPGKEEAARYVETALAWRDAGSAVPFAIRCVEDDAVIGSS